MKNNEQMSWHETVLGYWNEVEECASGRQPWRYDQLAQVLVSGGRRPRWRFDMPKFLRELNNGNIEFSALTVPIIIGPLPFGHDREHVSNVHQRLVYSAFCWCIEHGLNNVLVEQNTFETYRPDVTATTPNGTCVHFECGDTESRKVLQMLRDQRIVFVMPFNTATIAERSGRTYRFVPKPDLPEEDEEYLAEINAAIDKLDVPYMRPNR